MQFHILLALAVSALAACSHAPPGAPVGSHLRQSDAKVGIDRTAPEAVPPPRTMTAPARPEQPLSVPAETYSVVVDNVPARELLFALARDARLNIDVHPGITGQVTLNAVDASLPRLLDRIARQIDIRWDLDGSNLAIMPDRPYLETYRIDFPNMTRVVKSEIATATQIANAVGEAPNGADGNSASTTVRSDTRNDLMESLIANVADMLREEDRLRYRASIETEVAAQVVAAGSGHAALSAGGRVRQPDGAAEATGPGVTGSGDQQVDTRAAARRKIGEFEPSASVFANKETGVLIVRATRRQHDKIRRFLDLVMDTAKRQVLIEATVVEVNLSNEYQQGIDWSALRNGARGFRIVQQAGTSPPLPSANPLNFFTLAYANPATALGSLAVEISLLESFGTVKVLSSPKLSVMNNQTATLKVAEDEVYFTLKSLTTTSGGGLSHTTYTSTPNSLTVGFVMNVTPQISAENEVTINIRPTITRVTGYVNDPNPELARAGVINRVPKIQTREMESIVRIASGEIAVMGGLMQEEMRRLDDTTPGLAALPVIGRLFRNTSDRSSKTELVIFLRPTVIASASVRGDYSAYRDRLPDTGFFRQK